MHQVCCPAPRSPKLHVFPSGDTKNMRATREIEEMCRSVHLRVQNVATSATADGLHKEISYLARSSAETPTVGPPATQHTHRYVLRFVSSTLFKASISAFGTILSELISTLRHPPPPPGHRPRAHAHAPHAPHARTHTHTHTTSSSPSPSSSTTTHKAPNR